MISIRLNRRDVCHNLAVRLACMWCHVVGAQALYSWDRMTPTRDQEEQGERRRLETDQVTAVNGQPDVVTIRLAKRGRG